MNFNGLNKHSYRNKIHSNFNNKKTFKLIEWDRKILIIITIML